MKTVEEFYDENYTDANHFYTSVMGVSCISPKKVQEAMYEYAEYCIGFAYNEGYNDAMKRPEYKH